MQKNNDTSSTVLYVVNIAARLLVICAFIAALVASVNFITKDKIALNQKMATAEALSGIYAGDGLVFTVSADGEYAVCDQEGNVIGACEAVEGEWTENIDAIYEISLSDGNVFGYCAEASPMCFKDEVGLIIAAKPDGSLRQVEVISLKETKGIGDKILSADFLDKFKNKTSGFTVDAAERKGYLIAGATRTSEPVTLAIDEALGGIMQVIGTEKEGQQ